MKTSNFAIIGGDARNLYIKELLRNGGHCVKSFALCASDEKSLEDALEDGVYIIAPTPFTKDGVYINAPLSAKNVLIVDFLNTVSRFGGVLLAGAINRAVLRDIDERGIRAFDFLAGKEAAIRNAIPTAEGALAIAVQNTVETLHGGRALVVGFGNIGKVLADYLRALGAETFVAARRAESLAEAESRSHKSVLIGDYERFAGVLAQADIIFNTVPFPVIDAAAADFIKDGAVYIELASSPYGIDRTAAAENNVTLIDAPSLPGKFAPKTAAGYLLNVIYGILEAEYESEK